MTTVHSLKRPFTPPYGDGPLFVAAVPGSGKTRATVNRIARLVFDGVDPALTHLSVMRPSRFLREAGLL